MTLRIVCLKSGDKYGSEYVLILQDMVRRNLPEGLEGEFVCFTDKPVEGVECRPLPDTKLNGWYNKIALFKSGLFPDGDRIVYFDLDTVITGPLDDIVTYQGEFAILRDAYRPNGLQSAVMLWEAGKHFHIWENYRIAGRPDFAGGDQEWIERQVKDPGILQKLYPGKFCSYKKDARFGIPKGCSVVFFHGEPRPHEVSGWVENVWKVGAGTPGELFLQGNTDAELVKRNILHAENLPNASWLKVCAPHGKSALICAGGPSLLDEMPSILAHAPKSDVFSCNGAQQTLRKHGVFTDVHVIVDARPENIDFAKPIHEATLCLYASQCDPAVLAEAGDRLVLWHPAIEGIGEILEPTRERIYVGGGTTCGMKAMVLAWMLGYREIHLYGFDSCYRGDQHHAYSQSLNDGERVLEVNFNGETYRCSPWMIQQAEDFQVFAPKLMDKGVSISVHGSGLIAHIAAEFAKGNFPFDSSDMRAAAILSRLDGIPEPVVAEIGVFTGALSSRLLARRNDLRLIMIDSWGDGFAPDYRASTDFHARMAKAEHEECFLSAQAAVRFANERVTILRGTSREMADRIQDSSLDLAFIDADHTYEGCKADILAYYSKVKPGGLISGHDYANTEWEFGPTVKRAVDEFVQSHGLTLELGENWTWFAKKPMEN